MVALLAGRVLENLLGEIARSTNESECCSPTGQVGLLSGPLGCLFRQGSLARGLDFYKHGR